MTIACVRAVAGCHPNRVARRGGRCDLRGMVKHVRMKTQTGLPAAVGVVTCTGKPADSAVYPNRVARRGGRCDTEYEVDSGYGPKQGCPPRWAL